MAEETKKLASARASYLLLNTSPGSTSVHSVTANPWTPGTVDKMSYGYSYGDDNTQYKRIINDCRFFFKHDPLASTVIHKVVDLSMNDLILDPESNVSKTEDQIFQSLKKEIMPFLRDAAFEYLISGLVVPEVKFTRLYKTALRDRHIQRLSSLLYPTSMWVRDSKSIEIKRPLITEKESYFVEIPEDVVVFIQSGGTYPDGQKDVELYKEIVKLYPEFVEQIMNNQYKVLLENPLVIKSTTLPETPYPIPYLFSALESLKHKRNLRRMDYAVAARIISAILHVKVGSDEFPLTEDQEDELTDLEEKFKWRQNLSTDDIERVFAFFTNHTVSLEWVYPEIDVLLDDKKYDTVNQDIMVALGFPRILITGETERSFASDPQIATLSPIQTMEHIQKKLLPIAEKIYHEMAKNNRVINTVPRIQFQPINLMSLQLFYEGLGKLYEEGNLSRQTHTEAYGFNLKEELKKRAEEQEIFDELNLEEFAPVPHSNVPGGESEKKPGRKKSAPEAKGKTPTKK